MRRYAVSITADVAEEKQTGRTPYEWGGEDCLDLRIQGFSRTLTL
jgi:hypothetical protein